VTGYADSTGSAAINTKLSEDRAKAVITYLIQQGSVPMWHIVAPGAMGEYGAAAPNETKAPGGPRTVGLRLKSWSTRASPVARALRRGLGGSPLLLLRPVALLRRLLQPQACCYAAAAA
jgi:outer membrane protein OmpA-like peptidoglycan-associated protein